MTEPNPGQIFVQQASTPSCPICGGSRFGDYRGRKAVRCGSCGSLERTRMLALALQSINPQPTGAPLMHFAPERGMLRLLKEMFGDAYTPADFEPANYSWCPEPVKKVDLSDPLAFIRPESVQGLVHCHVLEHVPADIGNTIRAMNRAVQPGGFHAFVVPFFSEWYREDVSPTMTHDQREALFGQLDHVRSFGKKDFKSRIFPAFEGFERVDLSTRISGAALRAAAVPANALSSLTSHTVFYFQKLR